MHGPEIAEDNSAEVLMRNTNKNLKNQKGQSLVEYLILVSIIGVGTMAISRSLGHQLNSRFAQVVSSLGGKVEGNVDNTTITQETLRKKNMTDFFSNAK